MRKKYINKYYAQAETIVKAIDICLEQFTERLHKIEKVAFKVKDKKILSIEGVNQAVKITQDYAEKDFNALFDTVSKIKALQQELKTLPKDA